MQPNVRSLSPQESRVVLALTEEKRRDTTRTEIIRLLGGEKAADHVIESLRQKGWLERASWGKYLLVPPDLGPQILDKSSVLALASNIARPYYIGYGSAAAYYGFTTQHRHVVILVTPMKVRARRVGESRVQIVNPKPEKFFGFASVDVLGHEVTMSDREKTAIDCIDRPELAGGAAEAAYILATASRRMDWQKAAEYLKRINSKALIRRFGWTMDHVKADMPAEVREELLKTAKKDPRTWFGPNPQRRVTGAIGYDRIWHLFVNVSEKEMAASARLGQRKILKKDRTHAQRS
jgi:predicted transcriptional regulator of viral defense system